MVKKLIDYELILAWKKGSRPFRLQKLGFKALPQLSKAYKEAKAITLLVASASGLEKDSVKLVAVGAMGIMNELRDEHAPWLKKQNKELKAQISKANSLDLKSKVVKRLIRGDSNSGAKEITFKLITNPDRVPPIEKPKRKKEQKKSR